MKTMLNEKDAEAVYEILTRELAVDRAQLTPGTLIADFSPDSLTIIEISMALEERFDFSISDESWERIKTVGEVFELVAELQESSRKSPSVRC